MVQRQAGCSAAAVRFKCDLSIDHFEEELAFALWEYLEFRPAGSLSEQGIAFAGNGEYGIGRQLILPHLTVKQLRIDFYFRVLFGLRELTFISLGVMVLASLMQNHFGRVSREEIWTRVIITGTGTPRSGLGQVDSGVSDKVRGQNDGRPRLFLPWLPPILPTCDSPN